MTFQRGQTVWVRCVVQRKTDWLYGWFRGTYLCAAGAEYCHAVVMDPQDDEPRYFGDDEILDEEGYSKMMLTL